MNHANRLLSITLAAGLLAGCARDTLPPGSLTQQDTEARLESISEQLQTALMRAANDQGVLALSQFPPSSYDSTNPLGEIGAANLPRGTYTYNSGSWNLDAPNDDLSLTWSYQNGSSAPQEATLLLDWDATSPTRDVMTPDGPLAEVPTGASVTLTAAGERAAELGAEVAYYESPACPTGTLEPTSLTLDGTGTFLTLENVGFNTTSTGDDTTLQTQGKVMLTQDDIYLDWNITVNGGLVRAEDCFPEAVSFGGGSFAAELGGFTGDTRSLALRFAVAFNTSTVSNGAFVVNGDESRAITFSGPFTDDNGNGVPGDTLIVTYPGGVSSTLEDLLSGLEGGFRMLRLLRP